MVRKLDSKDFDNLKHAARLMAKKGREVVILPEINVKNPLYLQIFGENAKHYPNKCPDMIVDGKYFYEHKGYTTSNPDKSAINMIKHGTKQSNYLIFEKPDLSSTWLQRSLFNHLSNGSDIEELWLKEGEMLKLFYKKKVEQ